MSAGFRRFALRKNHPIRHHERLASSRRAIGTTAVVVVTIMVVTVGVVALGSLNSKFNVLGPSYTYSRTYSTSSSGGQCVQVGEPLYPSTQLVPLQSFVQNWGTNYRVVVNETAGIVIVTNTSGGGIGSANVSRLSFFIVGC